MPFMKIPWSKKPTKMNNLQTNNLQINDKVYISKDVEEIIKKQKGCGGFSQTNMADIPGQPGVVICVKKHCITVEVKGRQFDFHPDLLKCVPFGSSLPSPITEYSITEISTDNHNISLPDPEISNDSFLIPEVPTDDQINFSMSISTCAYSQFPKYISNENTQSLYDPPLDEGEICAIVFDTSKIERMSNTKILDNKEIFTGEFDTSKIENMSDAKMSDNKEIIASALNKSKIEYAPVTKMLDKIMCHKCQENNINYASDCGHCYCVLCKNIVKNCITCSKPCQFIKIHL